MNCDFVIFLIKTKWSKIWRKRVCFIEVTIPLPSGRLLWTFTIGEVCLQFLSTPNFYTSAVEYDPIFKQRDHFQTHRA